MKDLQHQFEASQRKSFKKKILPKINDAESKEEGMGVIKTPLKKKKNYKKK